MFRELHLDLVAAQMLATPLIALGLLAWVLAAIAVLLRARRRPISDTIALAALAAGALACGLGLIGFATLRARSTDATSSVPTLAPTVLERVRRQGDADAQRVAELALLAGALPLAVAAALVARRGTPGRSRRALAAAGVAIGIGAVVAWSIPPRGRQLDRRAWLLLDAESELQRGETASACVHLESLRTSGTAQEQTTRGPYLQEQSSLTPAQMLALVPEAPAMVDRCVDDAVRRYPDVDSLLADLQRFGWLNEVSRDRATRMFAESHPSASSAPPHSELGHVALDPSRVSGGAPETLTRAVFRNVEVRLLSCYRVALAAAPGLTGTMKIEVTLTKGHADSISITTALPEAVRQCAQGELKGAGYYEFEDVHAAVTLNVRMTP